MYNTLANTEANLAMLEQYTAQLTAQQQADFNAFVVGYFAAHTSSAEYKLALETATLHVL